MSCRAIELLGCACDLVSLVICVCRVRRDLSGGAVRRGSGAAAGAGRLSHGQGCQYLCLSASVLSVLSVLSVFVIVSANLKKRCHAQACHGRIMYSFVALVHGETKPS